MIVPVPVALIVTTSSTTISCSQESPESYVYEYRVSFVATAASDVLPSDREVVVPDDPTQRPSPLALDWHRAQVFERA